MSRKKIPTFPLGLVLLIWGLSSQVQSHSGGLNSQGCHAGSKPYHCHRSSSEMVPSSSGGYRLECSAGSQSKDCINSGQSSYSTSSQYTYKEIQLALYRHCSSIDFSFVDGVWGPTSVTALKKFQRSYNLQSDGFIYVETLEALRGEVKGWCK